MDNKKVVYQLDSDGYQETSYVYDAKTAREAMEKHVYFLSLSNGNVKIEDIEPTLYGHALQVGNTCYWCKG
jgi:hypothetical protein